MAEKLTGVMEARRRLREYMGEIPEYTEFVQDPMVGPCWAARTPAGDEFLIECDAPIGLDVEEVSYTSWPPTAII